MTSDPSALILRAADDEPQHNRNPREVCDVCWLDAKDEWDQAATALYFVDAYDRIYRRNHGRDPRD